ncbi:helix-turn-helix transcriptional regulator [Pseudoduganella sp. UC29_106]|uniref:helix-turn-helix transcriptional regulator n=1 Tax=Pseudoduganella sp. UC29_106 TaxID=3374553 RepID=UPI0037582C86
MSAAAPAAPSLPTVGMSRWQQLRHVIPVSREKWRQLVIAGKAPAPVRLSERCTMYANAEVHRWLADPVGYRQAEGGAE